jgi:hypothetical protein
VLNGWNRSSVSTNSNSQIINSTTMGMWVVILHEN